jgi:hypothetical protein
VTEENREFSRQEKGAEEDADVLERAKLEKQVRQSPRMLKRQRKRQQNQQRKRQQKQQQDQRKHAERVGNFVLPKKRTSRSQIEHIERMKLEQGKADEELEREKLQQDREGGGAEPPQYRTIFRWLRTLISPR